MKSADKKCIKPVENNTEKSLSRISKKMTRRLAIQTGQVAIIVGLALTALIGILAYVIDEGSIYEERRSLQSVADSASLAAVQELPEDPSGAVQKAIEYASLHGVSLAAGDVVIGSTFTSNDTATVTAVNPDREMFFAGIFGIDSTPVGADATAVVGSPGEFIGIVPWAVVDEDWVPGSEYTLKFDAHGSIYGNFQPLAIGGNGAKHYEETIANGASIPIKVGDIIDTEPGNMENPTRRGTKSRIYDKNNHTFDSFFSLVNEISGGYSLAKNDSQFVICPVIEELPNGRDEVQIIKFVPFIISEINSSEITGVFLNKALIIYNGEITGVDDSGIRVVRLIN
jgi:hypothetical protein